MTLALAGRRKRVEPPNRKGWVKLRRGLPEIDGGIPTSEAQWNYERLIARVGPNGAWILVYVLDRTQSGYAGPGIPPPEYTQIDVGMVADFLNVSPRHVRGMIQWLIGLEVLVSRCPQNPWSLKALPENFEKLPVLGTTKRPGRPGKLQKAALPAPTPIAAYHQSSAVNSTNTSDYPPTAGSFTGEEQTKIAEIDFPDVRQVFAVSGVSQASAAEGHIQTCAEARDAALADAARVAEHLGRPDVRDAILLLVARPSESQAKTVEVEFRPADDGMGNSISAAEKSNSEPGKSDSLPKRLDFRDPEVHCPLNLGCPYLCNDLADDKPVSLIKLTPQPASRQAGPTIEDVRAYLGCKTAPSFFEDIPTEKIFRETHANLQGAPLESLKRRIDIRGHGLRSMGAVPLLAKDVGDRWKAEESARTETERLRRSSEFHRMRENVLDSRSQLQNVWKAFQGTFG